MKPRVYIETAIPGFYHETRPEPEMVARRNWTRVPMGEARTGKGRTSRGKGFHSMRPTMISRMANEDVPPDVRRAIAGHASDAAHRRYTHLKLETQRRAIEALPAAGRKK